MNSGAPPRSGADLSYVLGCFREYRRAVLATLLFLALARVASTADPVFLKQVIDGLGAAGPAGAVTAGLAGYFACRLISMLCELARDWIFAPVIMGASRNLSESVFDRLLLLPVAYHAEQKTGALARRIARGTRSFTFLLDFAVSSILPTLAELLFVTGFLLRLYRPEYGLITFSTVAVYTVFTIWSTEKRQVYRLNANRAEDEASGLQVDSLINIETVKYFNNEDLRRRGFRAGLDRWHAFSVGSNRLFAAISAGQGTILLCGLGAILLLAVAQARQGLLTVGDVVLLSTYVVRVSIPIASLGFVYRGIKDCLSDLQEMGRVFEAPLTVRESDRPVTLPSPRGEVEFDGVSYAYPGREPVLRDLTLRIPAGDRVAVVGPSGSGKSTLVRLLFRFMDPTAGAIRVDGVDLREVARESRRSLLAIVPQEPVLFNDTIENNIRFGRENATAEEIREAVEMANISGLIDTLPEGLATVVGERGIKLSGGEKQRIAIARAIIRDPRILVFDEATSSLDTHSERIIQDSLERVARGRTAIIIAHRLSTIVDCDRIVVLDNGGIAESGDHRSLLERNGLYAHLWSLQARHGNGAGEPGPSEAAAA